MRCLRWGRSYLNGNGGRKGVAHCVNRIRKHLHHELRPWCLDMTSARTAWNTEILPEETARALEAWGEMKKIRFRTEMVAERPLLVIITLCSITTFCHSLNIQLYVANRYWRNETGNWCLWLRNLMIRNKIRRCHCNHRRLKVSDLRDRWILSAVVECT